MNTIWERITNWAKSKGGWNHLIAAGYVGTIAAYAAVPPFESLLNVIYAAMPTWSHELILAFLGVVAWYRNTRKVTL